MLCLHWVPWCVAYIGLRVSWWRMWQAVCCQRNVEHVLNIGCLDGACHTLCCKRKCLSGHLFLTLVISKNICRPWGRSVLCWDFTVAGLYLRLSAHHIRLQQARVIIHILPWTLNESQIIFQIHFLCKLSKDPQLFVSEIYETSTQRRSQPRLHRRGVLKL